MENSRPRNPKQTRLRSRRLQTWYPYYAGYSQDFVQDCIDLLNLPQDSTVLDPWNGSGTTTFTLKHNGLAGIGFDLNPVMVVVAKARLLSPTMLPSVSPLALELVNGVSAHDSSADSDALASWFKPGSVQLIKKLESSISRTLVPKGLRDLTIPQHVSALSTLSSFYYLALFRTVRMALKTFQSSNPTWIRLPRSDDNRISTSWRDISRLFLKEVAVMQNSVERHNVHDQDDADIRVMVGDARSLCLEDGEMDAIITSPPYCTRIDYAVATRPELAVLGFGLATGFSELRQRLMGGVTIRQSATVPRSRWGRTCLSTLEMIRDHTSKASETYYLRHFLQYFSDLELSFRELRRVISGEKNCIMVVQDSLYKEIHINLPKIAHEMANNFGFELMRKFSYKVSCSFRHLNPRARQHRRRWKPTEVVLLFRAT